MIVHVARDGAEVGQFSEQEFRDKIFSGEIQPDNHYWTEGMDAQRNAFRRRGARLQSRSFARWN